MDFSRYVGRVHMEKVTQRQCVPRMIKARVTVFSPFDQQRKPK
jgi:hypothetical protein